MKTSYMLRLIGGAVVSSTWLLVATALPVVAEDYGPGQPDPCAFVNESVWLSGPPVEPPINSAGGEGSRVCTASFELGDTAAGFRLWSIVSVHRFPGVFVGEAESRATRAMRTSQEAYGYVAAPYGHEGLEGPMSEGHYAVVFRVHNYLAIVQGNASTNDEISDLQGAAGRLSAKMMTDITAPPSYVGTTAPSSSGPPGSVLGPLSLGIGCGTDERYVRCTASVYGARPDADLVFVWRFDGATRPETGSTMEINWPLEGVAEGSHVVGVDVRDARNNIGPTTTSTSLVLGQVAPPSGGPTVDDAMKAALAGAATTAVTMAIAGAAGKAAGSATGEGASAVAPTTEADALDTALELGGAQTGSFPPIADIEAWRRLANWPPGMDADFNAAFFRCSASFSEGYGTAQNVLDCLRQLSREAWSKVPKPGVAPPSGPASPAPPAPSGPTPDDLGGGALDVIGADAGQLPPLTPDNYDKWKALSGWPDGADPAFRGAVEALLKQGKSPAEILEILRDAAVRLRQFQNDLRGM